MGIVFSLLYYTAPHKPITQDFKKSTCIFTPSGIKLAVIIGINYQDDDQDGNDLNGCVADSKRLKNYLTECCHFKEEDITLLCNSNETTKKSIESQLQELVLFSYKHPNTELWFSFSGHGSGMYSNEEKDQQCEVICPSDYSQNGVIMDTWLRNRFINRLHPSSKLFILMDCCHSGTNVNLPYQLIDKQETLINNDNNDLLYPVVVKLSGCQDNQTSVEYYDKNDNEYQGALTTCFLANANEYNGSVFSLLCDNVKKGLENKDFQQIPMLTFSQLGLSKWRLF
tara:strand:+ start:441 stop:1289 length:849 start_codon:yes stop_codon:yes gene_type:complete